MDAPHPSPPAAGLALVAARGLNLYAVGSDNKLVHFADVDFRGGNAGDLPSQGDLTVETDRAIVKVPCVARARAP